MNNSAPAPGSSDQVLPDPVLKDETHISSLVVQAKPEAVAGLAQRIGAMDQTEVPIASPRGKLVVCLETRVLSEVTNSIDIITNLPGVLGCTLVSHHVEDTAGLDEPVDAPTPEMTETTI